VRLSAKGLEPEETFYLPPDDERNVGREDEQREENGEEAKARERTLLPPLLSDPAACAVEPVPTLDRGRVERRRLVGGIGAPRRLGHGGTL
jgi:hypothetical protein